mmetsp:Transcript_35984/g.46235  ORF Transcript_35984/g.46235 Transcript_35984/m.46235 type:complete len:692 (+) Transcript_35984:269-2344(+)
MGMLNLLRIAVVAFLISCGNCNDGENRKQKQQPQVMFSTAHSSVQELEVIQELRDGARAVQIEEETLKKSHSKSHNRHRNDHRHLAAATDPVYSPSRPPEVIPDGGTYVTAVGVTLIDRDSNSSIIYYTTDGTSPSRETSEYVQSGGIIGMYEGGRVRAFISSASNDSSLDSETTVSERFRIQQGKVGKLLLTPFHHGRGFSGKVALLDLDSEAYSIVRIHEVFTDFGDYYSRLGIGPYESSLRIYDLTQDDPDLKGFWGAVYAKYNDINYGFLVPNYNGDRYFGKVVRINMDDFWAEKNDTEIRVCSEADTQWFPNRCHISVLNIDAVHTHLRGFVSGFSHGDHIYLIPLFHGHAKRPNSHLVRFHAGDFNSSTVEWIDLVEFDPRLGGYYGALTYKDTAYLVPYRTTTGPVGGMHTTYTVDGFKPIETFSPHLEQGGGNLEVTYSGLIPQINLTTFNVTGILNLADIYPDLCGFAGGFVAGKYGFMVPYKNQEAMEGGYHGNMVKLDLETFELVGRLDLSVVDENLVGFVGGFAYGKYGYIVPYANANTDIGCMGRQQHGRIVRVDLEDFTIDTVVKMDLPSISRQQVPTQPMDTLCGYIHGVAVGHYGYLIPHFNGVRHGKIVRIDMRDYEFLAGLQEAGESTNVNNGNDGIQVCDISMADEELVGFAGGLGYHIHDTQGGIGTPGPS